MLENKNHNFALLLKQEIPNTFHKYFFLKLYKYEDYLMILKGKQTIHL